MWIAFQLKFTYTILLLEDIQLADLVLNIKRIEKYIENGDQSQIFKNKLDKFCFVHDSAYDKHKDVQNRQIADKN